MDLSSFRIKNYRSIKDSGECYLSGDFITILAGKNESGKTAILEALEDFNYYKNIRDEAIQLHEPDLKPEISLSFKLDTESFEEIAEQVSLNYAISKPITITVKKTYPNIYFYVLPKPIEEKLSGQIDDKLNEDRQRIHEIRSQILNLISSYPQIEDEVPEADLDNVSNTITEFTSFNNNILPKLDTIPDVSPREAITESIQNVLIILNSLKKPESKRQNFIDELANFIPNFILFSSFEDIFPSEVALTEAQNNEMINDLNIISDLNLGVVTSGSNPIKKRHKEQLNIKLQEDYRTFWTQDMTNLCIDWDSNYLQFYISENDYYYPPNMRSKGKQWHLSFYVRVTARAREDVPNIILIDEPGLYLHAQAQKDIISKLEDCAEDVTVIFSTHSPYLINSNKLSRIRLVLKPSEKKGTVISNKIHKTADVETLTPIITAIGLDLSMGLDIAKDNNVIFEGITDYYYILAFIKILKFKFTKEVNIIPGAGADKLNLLVSLMIGWGLNYSVILDNDSTGRRVNNELQKSFNSSNIKIEFVSQNNDMEIEDLFSKEDFVKHIINEKLENIPANRTNSKMIKQKGNKYDKVLLAKSFYEKSNSRIRISEETKNNFKDLLERIDRLMF